MSRNGSGTMSIINSFSANTTIESAKVNQNFTDIGSEITNSLPRNGEAAMTGQMKSASGTVSAPGVTFSSDLDCGLYLIGTNNVGLAAGGSKILDVATTGLTVTGALTTTTLELGGATDATIARSGAGDITVEGNTVYRAGGTDVALIDGGTGASLTDPNADRILFWDDSAGAVTWLTASTGLAITTTDIAIDAASQSDQETGTSTAKVVTPGVMKHFPGVLKAFWDVDQSSGTAALQASYGVSSVTDSTTGQFDINLSTAMSSINYAITVGSTAGVASAPVMVNIEPNPTTTLIPIRTFGTAFNETDSTGQYGHVSGDQ